MNDQTELWGTEIYTISQDCYSTNTMTVYDLIDDLEAQLYRIGVRDPDFPDGVPPFLVLHEINGYVTYLDPCWFSSVSFHAVPIEFDIPPDPSLPVRSSGPKRSRPPQKPVTTRPESTGSTQ